MGLCFLGKLALWDLMSRTRSSREALSGTRATQLARSHGSAAALENFGVRDMRPSSESTQLMAKARGEEPVQRQSAPNKTGMPDNLKNGIEKLSGYDMSDVRVHYNSSKPAQLNAHAYAQGSNIHVAPGQEKHLAHEAWHTVQQKQNRVKPTMQSNGVAINDNAGLEREADVMGAKASSL